FFPSRWITPNRSESRWSKSSGKIWNSASSSSCNFFGSAEISAALSSLKMIWNTGNVICSIVTSIRLPILDSYKYAPHTCANSRRDLPCNRARLRGQFRAGNFLISSASHENDLIAYLCVIDVADIDHHQIHRYAAQERATVTANENCSVAIGKMSRISIGIAAGQRGDPHFSRSNKRAA